MPNLEFSISYTTRQPRGSEQNGREYFFVTREEFEKMIAEDQFLEYAEVFGNYYGTARSFLREAFARGNDLILDIDVQGAAQVKKKTARGGQHLHPSAVAGGAGEPAAATDAGGERSAPRADGRGNAGRQDWRRSCSAACRKPRARLRIIRSMTIFW